MVQYSQAISRPGDYNGGSEMSMTNLAIGSAAVLGFLQVAAMVVLPEVDKHPRVLVVHELSYNGGYFSQRVGPIGSGTMSGKWTAEVNRIDNGVTKQLCAGSGVGNYSGDKDVYTADDWTGANCPTLLPGDIAEATWTFDDENGAKQSIAATIHIAE